MKDQFGHDISSSGVYRQKYFDLKMLVKQLRTHEKEGVGSEEGAFKKYVAKRAFLQKLVDDFIKGDNMNV